MGFENNSEHSNTSQLQIKGQSLSVNVNNMATAKMQGGHLGCCHERTHKIQPESSF